VFDLQDPSQLPTISEPLFSKLKANIQMFPVMDREDLQKGLGELGGGAYSARTKHRGRLRGRARGTDYALRAFSFGVMSRSRFISRPLPEA
jgi:hypothetical protein